MYDCYSPNDPPRNFHGSHDHTASLSFAFQSGINFSVMYVDFRLSGLPSRVNALPNFSSASTNNIILSENDTDSYRRHDILSCFLGR